MGIAFETWTDEDYQRLNQVELVNREALDILTWAYTTFSNQLVYSCSFGVEGIVLIDLISKVKQDAKIVFLDTNFHFQETYDLIEKVKRKYPSLEITSLLPSISPKEQARQYGAELWRNDPDLCCEIRKLQPLAEELSKYEAWISGLRREQSETRKHVEFVNRDTRFQSVKICPLIHWTWDDVWNYIHLHKLPYNELHDKNYPSIGCEHCTQAVREGEDFRSGRWASMVKTECGLHENNCVMNKEG